MITEAQVNAQWSHNQFMPAVAGLSDGGFVVSWSSQIGNADGGVWAARFDDTGDPVAAGNVQVLSKSGHVGQTDVVGLSGGGFAVIWDQELSESPGSAEYEVYSVAYGSDGQALNGAGTQINSFTPWDQRDPAAASTSDGGYVVVWRSSNQDGDAQGIRARFIDASGAPQGASDWAVNSATTGDQERPDVATLASGDLVVTWSGGPNGEEVYGQRFTSAGAMDGSAFMVNQYTTAAQGVPRIAALTNGRFVITYFSEGSDDVRARLYDGDGSWQPSHSSWLPSSQMVSSQASPVPSSSASPW